jgi:serine/threonine protein kinase
MKFLRSLFRRRQTVQKTDIVRRFDLLSQLGSGSMSRVFRAVDKNTGRTVAVKILDPEKTARYEARFTDRVKPTEGQVSLELSHPHIVRTFDHGLTTNNEQFLVMELIEGISLSYLVDMQNEAMQEHRLRIMVELAEAVEYLHKEDWIHRDICPRNVIMDKQYGTKLIDFGLVVPNTLAFQEPGNRTGTANYMAPELIKRLRTDERIDIFSFAVTCYEMTCRQLPWPALTTASLEGLLKRINHKPLNLKEVAPATDSQVSATIMRGLEADPRDRWPSMTEMLAELRSAYRRLKPRDGKRKGEPAEVEEEQPRDQFSEKWQFRTT